MSTFLHPPGFVETVGCSGPNYIRSQPSRSTPGTLLNACTDKYTTEFELPYKNIQRYINEMTTNWEKLTNQDKEKFLQQIRNNVPSLSSQLSNNINLFPKGQNSFAAPSSSDDNFSFKTDLPTIAITLSIGFIVFLILAALFKKWSTPSTMSTR